MLGRTLSQRRCTVKPVTGQHTVGILRLTFLLVLFFSIIEGCSKDGSSSTSPSDPTPHSAYPSVVRDWTGYCFVNGSNRQTLVATFTQQADSMLNSTINFKLDSTVWEMTENFHGKITTARQISLTGTEFTVIGGPGNRWGLYNITATLSTGADTIAGSYIIFTGLATGDSGPIVLVKK
jgi:hypothetical protein